MYSDRDLYDFPGYSGEFDFLKKHGYGVVYGAEAVKQKIFELGHLDPTRKNNMTEITGYTVEDVLPLLDEEGNPVVVQVGEGEVATPDEVII